MEENKIDSNDTGEGKKKERKKIPPNKILLFISESYLSDLECLREMYASVLPVLREQDKERKKTVDDILDRVKKQKKEIKESGNATKSSDQGNEITILSSDFQTLLANVQKLNRAEQLFKQQVTVSLVSRFDEYLGKLLRIVLRIHPEWLTSSDKTITYKELVSIDSIDKAIAGLIHKEVENLLRGSHEDQIAFIDEKLKLGINKTFSRLADFLEVAERRNLCVHTGGKVSQQYIDKCEAFGFKNNNSLSVGSNLNIDSEYFNNAFSLCFEIGLRISQAAYRRLFPDQLEDIDKSSNNLAIKFLNSGDYNLAETVADFDLGIPDKLRSKDTEYLYFARINRAIAQKFAGKEFKRGLEGVHWQAFHPKYSLALAVLDDDFDKAVEMIKSAAIQESIGKIGLRTWPLFKKLRRSEVFKETYLKLYEEEYVPDPQENLEEAPILEDQLFENEC